MQADCFTTRHAFIMGPAAFEMEKKVLWLLGQKELFDNASLLHATSENEYKEIRAFGSRQPVAVIPNGIDMPGDIKSLKTENGNRKLVFLSRIHETKGLDVLLNAWGAIHGSFPEWELVIAGPLEGGYPRYIQNLSKQKKLKNVKFTGELRGKEKADFFSMQIFLSFPRVRRTSDLLWQKRSPTVCRS
ncbi:MAG: glycosyltransferase [Methanosarcinales archaeon]|nr:MAG: glycosyltransferase [Methanosarcinales archaeon]